MSYAGAQVFNFDPGLFSQATQACVTGVDLYFKDKPDSTTNKSGIESPGVTVYLVPTSNGVPATSGFEACPQVRIDHDSVATPNSTHHLPGTHFEFDTPVTLQTGQSYAFVVKFDGQEDFVLWFDKRGWPIETDADGDTTQISPGTRTPQVGKMFNWNALGPIYQSGQSQANLGYYVMGQNDVLSQGFWSEATDTVLTFKLYAGRWAVSGNTSPVANDANATTTVTTSLANGAVRFALPSRRYEYVVYDHNQSSNSGVLAGERVYQNTVYHPGGTSNVTTLSVVGGSNLVSYSGGAAVNFSTLFNMGGPGTEWVVMVSEDHNGNNADLCFVGRVTNVVSNTSFTCDQPVNFTNAAVRFFRSPVATVDQFLRSARVFGTLGDALVLIDSTANSSMRFVNDAINSVSIVAAGNGYSNSDTVTVTGFENVSTMVIGGYPAKANVVTDGNGAITGVYFSNIGCGYVNASAVSFSILNSTAQPSSGTGANLSFTVGSMIKSEHLGLTGGGGYFLNCKLVDLEVGEELPTLVVDNPAGTFYTARQRLPYYKELTGSTYSGTVTRCDADGDWDEFQVQSSQLHEPWELNKARLMPSWSNELVAPYANGSSSNGRGGSTAGNAVPMTSNASVLLFDCGSNTDFNAIKVRAGQTQVAYFRYIVNDDYSDENTDHGAAWAKGVETKITLANGTFAEDVRIFATVHRPAGTNVECFARFFNSHDSEAFDDKDWTMLQLVDGNTALSNPRNPQDFVELTWGLQQYPNTGPILGGVVTTVLNSSNLAGANTTWNTDLSAGDLVVLSSRLFPSHYQVAVVNSVVNSTLVTLHSPVANDDMVGTGFQLAKVLYPNQAFSNWLNDNVVRYYSTGMVEYDTFDVLQLKLVMTSNSSTVVPSLDDVRATCLSA